MGFVAMSRVRQEPPRSAATVTANVARALLGYAASKGHDPMALAARFGLSLEALQDIDARISVYAALRLWDELPALLDDDDLGMSLARHVAPHGALLPVLLVANAATFGEGITRAMELQRALAEGSTWTLEPAGPGRVAWVYEVTDPVAEAPRPVHEFGLTLMLLVARRVVGDDVCPAALRFRHAAPRNAAAHGAFYGCPVRYGCARTELHLTEDLLARPIQTANPAVFEHLTAHGRTQIRALPESDGLVDRVRHALRGVSAPATLESVAERVGCAPRSLQRRLREAGTSLHALADEARYARARALLEDPALEVKQVAAALGFSEQAAFHRAFVRWSGTSPGRWRAGERADRGTGRA